MPLGVLIANYEDLGRLRHLEATGHFKPGFANETRDACVRTLVRVIELALVNLLIPYPGPTITR